LLVARYIDWVLRHRRMVLAVCVGITVLSGAGLTRAVFASSMIKVFFGESAAYNRYLALIERFGDSDLTFLAVEDETLFTPQGWARADRITRGLAALADFKRVHSVTNALRIRGHDSELEVRTYNEVVGQTGDFEALRKDILADDLLRGVLISEDGSCAAFALEIIPDDDRKMERLPLLFDEIYQVFEAEGISRDRIHSAGLVSESLEVGSQAVFTIQRIFPFTLLILIGLVFFIFRQLWPVLLTSGVALVSMMWTFAFAVLLEPQINIMMAIVPAVMLTVAFSDIIHLCYPTCSSLNRGTTRTTRCARAAPRSARRASTRR